VKLDNLNSWAWWDRRMGWVVLAALAVLQLLGSFKF
jgi:hypothetical protein